MKQTWRHTGTELNQQSSVVYSSMRSVGADGGGKVFSHCLAETDRMHNSTFRCHPRVHHGNTAVSINLAGLQERKALSHEEHMINKTLDRHLKVAEE